LTQHGTDGRDRVERVGEGLDGQEQLVEPSLHTGEGNVLLGGEVPEERALGHGADGDDVGHPCGGEPLLGEQLEGRIAERVVRLRLLRGPPTGLNHGTDRTGTSGIAQREAEALGPLLLGLRGRLDATLLVIEHDITLISSISDRLIALDQGAIVTQGPPGEVLDHPEVVASYLGTGSATLGGSDHANRSFPMSAPISSSSITSTADRHRPWESLSTALRIGPAVLLVVLLVGATLFATVAGRTKPTQVIAGPPLSEVLTYESNPDLPITYEDAKKAGTVDNYDWGPCCDTERRYNDTDQKLARLAIPSTYAPPCVPKWNGAKPCVSKGGRTFTDNGGATASGVTATSIRVVFYLPAEQDIAKQLEHFGVLDGADATLAGVQQLVEMSNNLYETYGRKVEVVPFRASGDGCSPSAARADAVRVVEMGAFASIGGPSQTTAYQLELARSGVLCIQCGYASTDDVLGSTAPYAWGYQATPDQLLYGVFGLGAGMLQGKPARFAGEPAFASKARKIGVVHYEQDPPIFGPLKEEAIARFSSQGVEASTIIQYILDPNTLNAQAQAIIGRLKREDVTSVVFLGDPLMPRLLMQQATKQNYHPEWMFTGTALTDTSAVGRLYDQDQMAHTFGASSTAARTAPEVSESWQLVKWWFGEAPTSPKTVLSFGPVIELMYLGIDLAGPNLSAKTFAGGLFSYPATGGTQIIGRSTLELFAGGYLLGDTTPAISFGRRGGADGAVDYVAVDDFTTVWWNSKVQGPDENGTQASGLWMYTGMGLRLPLSSPQFPPEVTEDFLFQEMLSGAGGALYEQLKAAGIPDFRIAQAILDKTPPLETLPVYAPWPESPAAKGG